MNRRSHAVAQLVASLALVWGYVLTDWFWVASASLGCLLWAVGFALWPSRRVRVGSDKPTTSGLLSMAELAEACDKRLRVEPEAEPAAPDPLPAGLRDTGFVESKQKRSVMREKLLHSKAYQDDWERFYRMRSMTFGMLGVVSEDNYAPKLRPVDRAKVDAIPLVAERGYTALTHCPEGHIGDHWIGDLADDNTVTRTCRWAKCGATWQEKAWTTAA